MLTATVLRSKKEEYTTCANRLLPQSCPRCDAPKDKLILDSEDINYAYCWSHFGEIYIGPQREPHFRVRDEHYSSARSRSKLLDRDDLV